MKKITSTILSLAMGAAIFTGCSTTKSASAAQTGEKKMNKNTFTQVKLTKGQMNVFDFGSVKLHAYKTKDFIDDEVFIVEKAGKTVVIESPCFFDNNRELEEYLKGKEVAGVLVSYHGAGATFLPDVPKYATQNAVEYSANGGGKALITNFTKAFGAGFDGSVHKVTNVIGEGKINIGGIDFVIKQTAEAFDIEIPEINAVYTHMLGHDCHSIIAGPAHADVVIAELKSYIAKGYSLILTAHYTPEDLKDAQTKIDYLENIKAIAKTSKNGADFKAKVRSAYPDYAGENYLDMTTGLFFK
ncbi:MAG: hypothetical protein UHY90_06850 [Treponema sp.]|nr:hypothetical protein [Treponema sp.]